MAEAEVHGPIDFIVIEWPGEKMKGEAAEALLDLVDKGIVRIYDILVVAKDEDGSFRGFSIEDTGAGESFSAFSGARSGLLGDDDIAEAANALAPGTVAALIVYENTWAIPFVAAARRAGAELVASARIPAQDVMDALEALEASDEMHPVS